MNFYNNQLLSRGNGYYARFGMAFSKFAYSIGYVYGVCALAALANMASLEIPVYTCYILMAIGICLFCRDFLPITPIVVSCYIAPSLRNNPGVNSNTIFSAEGGGIYLLILVAAFLIALLWRLRTDKEVGFRKLFQTKRRLSAGILLLGIAYMLSGLGATWGKGLFIKNLFFSFLQFISVALFYFLLTGMVGWGKSYKRYFAHVGVALGLAICAELAFIYATQPVLQDGIIHRKYIYTGWGMYNNLGGLLIMLLPFPFYFACRGRRYFGGIGMAVLFMIGALFTNSRGSILTGLLIFVLGTLLTVMFAHKRRKTAIIFTAVLVSTGVGLALWGDVFARLFQEILEKGMETTRYEIYDNGIRQFLKYPLLGGGFYPIDYIPWDFSEIAAFSSFFPPRWHNTVIQLLACCGITGLIAYGLHCLQVTVLLIKKASMFKAVVALSCLALMVSSMVDCHFFNIGPVLFYSIALALAECSDAEKM